MNSNFDGGLIACGSVKPPRPVDGAAVETLRPALAAPLETLVKHAISARAGWLVAACLSSTIPAHAANLVVNGDFEAGTLAGWTTAGDTAYIGVANAIAHGGTWAAYAGPDPSGSIAQVLTTTPGQSYGVSFWLQLDDSATPNNFSWSWNGVAQGAAMSDVSAFAYTRFGATVAATGASTMLQFNFANPQSFWLLDDVAVSAVPEPAGAALRLPGCWRWARCGGVRARFEQVTRGDCK